MNKTELVAKVADITGVGRNDVRAVIDCCFDTITNILEMDGKVSLAGFGTFSVSEKMPRAGYNPHTGEHIEIPGRRAVRFKCGADMDTRIR
ncbi:HU family DNA-binding protein [Muribaculaceae bacterium Isolate-042 (Harlan)]|uniref:HU family DNA-binding protein n=1 Tax=Muribaculum intestinale TaxID=1796646 RepID=UPI000F4A602E|nr:HU family DNA-binding protein [Muribaculum intestinale]ROS79839.1 HU family DNA-binding protein [Muribaculaceae bacterium Isolate-042 (Harlan)]